MPGDNLWNGAQETKLKCGCCIIQLIGIHSGTHTIFGRVLTTEKQQYHSTTLQFLLEGMLREVEKQGIQPLKATELLQLGSVWKLCAVLCGKKDKCNGNRSETKLKRTRQFLKDQTGSWNPSGGECLRVHVRPSRFPATYTVDWAVPVANDPLADPPKAILVSNDDFGFLMVHKPSGVPSHATVDNGVENVLHQLILQGFVDCSLPQRLDTETEGLLLVATKPEFAAFLGRLLQEKTRGVVGGSETTVSPTIQKQYKCLVHVPALADRKSLLQRIHKTGGLIEHFMDPNSKVPRAFEPEAKEGWLKCVLRLVDLGPPMTLMNLTPQIAEANKPWSPQLVMEIRVQLLTGRTHQIRGQLAALGFPLVGDPLYPKQAGSQQDLDWDAVRNRGTAGSGPTAHNRLALQCCSLGFPKPMWTTNKKQRPTLSLDIAGGGMNFELDKAWWTSLVVSMNV